jgi:hypothetical protein
MTIGAMGVLAGGGGGVEGGAAPAVAPGAAGGFDAVMAAVLPGAPASVAPATVVPEIGAVFAAALPSEAPFTPAAAGMQALPPVRPDNTAAVAPDRDDSDGSGAAALARTPALAAHDPPASRPAGTAAAPSPDSTAPGGPDHGPRWATLRRVARPLPVEPPVPPAGAPASQLPLTITPHRLPGAALGQSALESDGGPLVAEPGVAAPPVIVLTLAGRAAVAPVASARSQGAGREPATAETTLSDAAPPEPATGAAAVLAAGPGLPLPTPQLAPAVANAPASGQRPPSQSAADAATAPVTPRPRPGIAGPAGIAAPTPIIVASGQTDGPADGAVLPVTMRAALPDVFARDRSLAALVVPASVAAPPNPGSALPFSPEIARNLPSRPLPAPAQRRETPRSALDFQPVTPPPGLTALPPTAVETAAALAEASTPPTQDLDLAVASDRLGPVRIAVEGGANDLRVALNVAPAAAALISADAPRLVADLAAQGVRLAALDVGGQSLMQQSPQQQFQQNHGDSRGRYTPPTPAPLLAEAVAAPRAASLRDRYA